jgi:hypothetical protein
MTFASFDWYLANLLVPAGITAVVVADSENAGYEAGIAEIGGQRWRIRTARTTPTKPGGFVSVWRRAADGSTEPFPASEPIRGLLVFAEAEGHRGVFHFDRAHLAELGVTSSAGSPGKRGFRVYPRWCRDLNPQALRSRRAQATAFTELSPHPSRQDITTAANVFRQA